MPGNLVNFQSAVGTEPFTDQAVAGSVVERPSGGGPSLFGSIGASQVTTGSQCTGTAPQQSGGFTPTNSFKTWPVATGNSNVQATAPPANANVGLEQGYIKVDTGTGTLNIQPTAGDTVNFATSSTAIALAGQGAHATIKSIGSNNWVIV